MCFAASVNVVFLHVTNGGGSSSGTPLMMPRYEAIFLLGGFGVLTLVHMG